MQPFRVIGIIGARSGSKGIPHKNIKPLMGKPLMSWIIDAAKKTTLIERVFVSTDSEEYAEIAKQYGAETPFLRPEAIANDSSTDIEYIQHTLEWLQKHQGYVPDIVLRLLPTTPLQRTEDIEACIRLLLEDPDAESAMIMTEVSQTPYKMFKPSIENPDYLVPFIDSDKKQDNSPQPRQKYPKVFIRGNMIASRYTTIQKGTLLGEKIRFHVVSRLDSIDIDHEHDFLVAEAILQNRINTNKSKH